MKKLAFIVNSLGVGGAEKHTVTLANNLNKRGYNITIFVLNNNMDLVDELDKEINLILVKVNKFYDRLIVKKIHDLCNEYDIDELFCVNTYPMLYGYKATQKTDIKCTVIHHTTELIGIKEKIKNIYLKKLMNKCYRRIFVSGNQKKYWNRKYNIINENTYVIRNGIDLENFKNDYYIDNNQLRKELKLGEEDLVMICGAMLRREKNHIQILKYIKSLVDSGYKNIKVLLLGDGIERHNIEEFIKENKLDNNVILLGLQKDVKKYYSISDIGVIGSKAVETFSIAALEQMSMGVPMIMTNIGGANEMIIDGFNGYLYELDDDTAFINIVKNIYKEKSTLKKLKTNARTLVKNNFCQEKMIDKYVNIINN